MSVVVQLVQSSDCRVDMVGRGTPCENVTESLAFGDTPKHRRSVVFCYGTPYGIQTDIACSTPWRFCGHIHNNRATDSPQTIFTSTTHGFWELANTLYFSFHCNTCFNLFSCTNYQNNACVFEEELPLVHTDLVSGLCSLENWSSQTRDDPISYFLSNTHIRYLSILRYLIIPILIPIFLIF